MELKSFAIPWQIRIHLFLFLASLLWIIVPAVNKAPSQLVTQKSVVAASEFLSALRDPARLRMRLCPIWMAYQAC